MLKIDQTENLYLSKINKISSLVLVLHLIVAGILALTNDMNLFFTLLMSVGIISLPIFLSLFTNNFKIAAISHGVALMFFSGLFIHLTKGMIEAHFHIFVAIAVLIVFANPFVILCAALTIAVHHVAFFFLLPRSVFNYDASFGILFIHASFVIIQTIPCMWIAQKYKNYIIEQGVVISQIDDICSTMNESIEKLSENNNSLSKSSNQQVDSVTKTAQTIHEIREMAEQTSQNAGHSKKISGLTKESAERGSKAIGEVGNAIAKIKKSNELLVSQINDNKNQLDDIVGTVKQIETKTQIINEIVFQTKLLSFNASVEAARAGEHGKGFSVVAEEIGKLASTSGEASTEINHLINSSVTKVQDIVKSSEAKVRELTKYSQDSIHEGEEKLKVCDVTFSELATYIEDLYDKAIGISVASDEQTLGISDINKAMHELEDSNIKTHENVEASVEVSKHLSSLADSLSNLVSQLNVKGL